MKKIFSFLMAAAVIVSLGSSCKKTPTAEPEGNETENNGNEGENGNQGENGNGEGQQEAPKYILTMDGDDSDWAALDQTYVVNLSVPEGRTAGHDVMKSAKIYIDPDYINIYFTFLDTLSQALHSNIYVDFDNSDETGGYDNQFTDPNSEYSFQSTIRAAGAKEFSEISTSLHMWTGEVGGKYNDPETGDLKNNWEWTSLMSMGEAVRGAGKQLANGISAYEYQISLDNEENSVIEMCDVNPVEIGIGIDILNGWTDLGCLPIGLEGLAPKAKVKFAPAQPK